LVILVVLILVILALILLVLILIVLVVLVLVVVLILHCKISQINLIIQAFFLYIGIIYKQRDFYSVYNSVMRFYRIDN